MIASKNGNQLIWQYENQKLVIEPWNANSLRVLGFLQGSGTANAYSALLPAGPAKDVKIEITERSASIQNGKIKAVIEPSRDRFDYLSIDVLSFYNAETGEELVSEKPAQFWPPARHLRYEGNHSVRIEYSLCSHDNEKARPEQSGKRRLLYRAAVFTLEQPQCS